MFSLNVLVTAGHSCSAHGHACTEIVFSWEAAGVLWQGPTSFAYRDGSVFVYQPGSVHWVKNRSAGEHICLGVVGGRAASLAEGIWQAPAGLRTRFMEVRQIQQTGGALQRDRLDLLAGLVVCDLLELQPEHRWNQGSRVQQAREIIEGQLSEELRLEGLAKRLSVSSEYLRQRFRKEFGVSITRYILGRRIELASRLLRTANDPIKLVAWQAGFPNEYYFSRAFRKAMGTTPTAYRAQHGVRNSLPAAKGTSIKTDG